MPPRRRPGAETVKVPIALPKEQYEWLRELAFEQRTTMAEVVREALRDHRSRSERTARSRARRAPGEGG
jgi:Arc/MetJ-type ribon-helix-helix transcriptional regulator